ncbi:MAG: SRPBCC domain-containing protein [Bacteroidales bacterium]
MKIKIEVLVKSDLWTVWNTWNNPEDIKHWNAVSDDWQTTSSRVDLWVGGRFESRMEARDGSAGFDFSGTYTAIEEPYLLDYRLEDDREVSVRLQETTDGILVHEEFDAEEENDVELQRQGWLAILSRFARYTESRTKQ